MTVPVVGFKSTTSDPRWWVAGTALALCLVPCFSYEFRIYLLSFEIEVSYQSVLQQISVYVL